MKDGTVFVFTAGIVVGLILATIIAQISTSTVCSL